MSQVAQLPGTDTGNCNPNMIQPIQSLRHAAHSFPSLPHQNRNGTSTQGTLHNLNCIGHSTPAVELITNFIDT